jgi:hypothetical protein
MTAGSTSQVHQALAGLAAGATTVAFLHPLDVVKTRLQVQDGSGPSPATRGMLDMARTMWATGGVRSLYAGTCDRSGLYVICVSHLKFTRTFMPSQDCGLPW